MQLALLSSIYKVVVKSSDNFESWFKKCQNFIEEHCSSCSVSHFDLLVHTRNFFEVIRMMSEKKPMDLKKPYHMSLRTVKKISSPKKILVRSKYSLISNGSELLAFKGEIEQRSYQGMSFLSCKEALRIPLVMVILLLAR